MVSNEADVKGTFNDTFANEKYMIHAASIHSYNLFLIKHRQKENRGNITGIYIMYLSLSIFS